MIERSPEGSRNHTLTDFDVRKWCSLLHHGVKEHVQRRVAGPTVGELETLQDVILLENSRELLRGKQPDRVRVPLARIRGKLFRGKTHIQDDCLLFCNLADLFCENAINLQVRH